MKRINWLMVLMSAVGGIIAFIIGEVLIELYKYKWPHSILMGVYFGTLALLIGIMCLLAEIIYPKINGWNWRKNSVATSFKFLIPCTLVLTFIFTAFFQFIYELSFKENRQINDVVVLMDTSGSMSKTDPKNERFQALNNLIDNLNSNNRAAVFEFSDHTDKVQAMDNVTPEVKNNILDGMERYKEPYGNTNMREALDKAIEEINNTKEQGRNSMVIMISDGGDNFDLQKKFDETIKPFQTDDVPIYTIGMSSADNFELLKDIAKATNGNYSNVRDVNSLKDSFVKIYRESQQRFLNGNRNGIYISSIVYSILRVLFITIISLIIAAGLSLVFDNKYLLKNFIIGGVISGLAAGLILEIGFSSIPWLGSTYRAISDILISIIFTLFISAEAREEERYKDDKSYIKHKSVVRVENRNSARHSF